MSRRKNSGSAAFIAGVLCLLFGLIVPPMLWPGENQILVGFVGAPFVLFGLILMLIGSFPTQRLEDGKKDDARDDTKRR